MFDSVTTRWLMILKLRSMFAERGAWSFDGRSLETSGFFLLYQQHYQTTLLI